MPQAPDRFVSLIAEITAAIEGRPIAPELADFLSAHFPPEGALFSELSRLCRQGRDESWLCAREAGGIKFGRPIKPSPATHGFSVDVVEMRDIVGPHHRHPHGEIDMIMPLDDGAIFDGTGRGWKVYAANTAHHPTVANGGALVLYLLPQGAIEFTDG